MKYLLNVAYKGTNYAGWQRQDNADTIQEEIEKAFYKLYKEPVTVMGASRTDAGVHALGQKCTFSVENNPIPADKLPYAINTHLPPDIAVSYAKSVPQDFHPIFDAKSKTYIYKIYSSEFRNPLIGDISWHIYHKLDLEKMKKAAEFLIGEFDFSAFCATGGSAKTSIRRINFAKVYEENGIIYYEVNGNGFLYNMVRIMTGTLAYVGQGKILADDIPKIIESKNRGNAGITAPPEGLCLKEVYYWESL